MTHPYDDHQHDAVIDRVDDAIVSHPDAVGVLAPQLLDAVRAGVLRETENRISDPQSDLWLKFRNALCGGFGDLHPIRDNITLTK